MNSEKKNEALIRYGICLALAVLVLLALVVWYQEILLLFFAAILLAVCLNSMAKPLRHYLGLPDFLATSVVLLALAAGAVGFLVFALPQVFEQTDELLKQLPEAWKRLTTYLTNNETAAKLLRWENLLDHIKALVLQAQLIFSSAASVGAALILWLVLGIFLALQPDSYLNQLNRFVSKSNQKALADLLLRTYQNLQWWLFGKLLSMVVIGVLTCAGLWLLEVPLVLILGIIAGLLSFVPNLGPLTALLPALLVAFANSPALAIKVSLLYGAVQLIEGFLILPFIQQKSISQPPALILAWQLLLGAFAGLFGVMLAAPLLVLIATIIDCLYLDRYQSEKATN